MDGNGVCGTKVVHNNWVYSIQPEGEGPTSASVWTPADMEPFTIPDDMEVVDVSQSDWQQILDNVIKPYGWSTNNLIVADASSVCSRVPCTSPVYFTKNVESFGEIPGQKFADDYPSSITWSNQGRTFQLNPGSFRVLLRSRQL